MESTTRIARRSIHTFLQHYHYFTAIPALLMLPFSASILLSQALSPPPLPTIDAIFKSFFHAIGFSPSPQFLSLLDTNLSQTILTSVFPLPFALTSLLIAKLLIIQPLIHHQKSSFPLPFSSFIILYKPLLWTQLCNLVLIIFFHVSVLSVFFFSLNALHAFGFPPNNPLILLLARTVFFSVLANSGVIYSLALVVAAWENCTGFAAIHKACLVSWKNKSIAFSMNLPINLSILAVEGLFRYRVIRAYHLMGRSGTSVAMEGLFIAYLHSLLLVIDTIASCLFLKSCKANIQTDNTEIY